MVCTDESAEPVEDEAVTNLRKEIELKKAIVAKLHEILKDADLQVGEARIMLTQIHTCTHTHTRTHTHTYAHECS